MQPLKDDATVQVLKRLYATVQRLLPAEHSYI